MTAARKTLHPFRHYEIYQPNEIKLGLWLSWTNSRVLKTRRSLT
jgi:hypothetical protein